MMQQIDTNQWRRTPITAAEKGFVEIKKNSSKACVTHYLSEGLLYLKKTFCLGGGSF